MLGRRVPGGRSAFGGKGCHGAGVDRLCGGSGFLIKSTRDIDDPARTASDAFAGTRGGAAEGAAEEGPSAAHEVEPGVKVEVEPIKNGREVGGNGSAFAAADDAAGFVDQGQVVIEGDDHRSVAGAGALEGATQMPASGLAARAALAAWRSVGVRSAASGCASSAAARCCA